MSDDEIYKAHGRALADAKKLKLEIAAIQIDLGNRNKDLKAIAHAIDELIQYPERREFGAALPPAGAIAHQLTREIDLASMAALALELSQKASELRILEERIKNF